MIYLIEQMKQMSWERAYATLIGKREQIIDFSLLLLITAFLLGYFEPRYLFLKTTTTGGDTASHYYTAQYLRDYLIPHGKISGWTQGNYAGFRILQFYFPLPFLIMAVLSFVMPLQIAFKLVTVLGIFLLPFCAYFSLRLMGFLFPAPIMGALFTLPFLFMEANSMWGGNIPSTLAGEFAYSLGFALTILFTGTLYRGILSGKYVLINALLVAVIGLSHGYTLLYAGVVSLFFLMTTNGFLKNLGYLFKIHTLGFLLMGIWIIPLIYDLPYTTRFNHVWVINSFFEVFPVILIPFIAFAILGRIVSGISVLMKIFKKRNGNPVIENEKQLTHEFDPRIYYLWFDVVVGGLFYFISHWINVVDIRFLPFVQIFLMMIGAVELGRAVRLLRTQWLFPVILTLLTLLWADHHSTTIKGWSDWNYSGFEERTMWPVFSSLNKYLTGTPNDPRVVYENSELNNDIGTIRAFESLPLFSGRSTLEGLYMQSSITTPFVFYIQSEVSKDISCPLSDYGCSRLNLRNGIEHFNMFNVRDFIVRSEEVKSEIKRYPEFVLKQKFGPFELYELSTNENKYVTLLKHEPVLYETNNWKEVSYRWFRKSELNDLHLVFVKRKEEVEPNRFRTTVTEAELDSLPKIPIHASCHVDEKIDDEEITIKTNCINQPLLIKISYHPNWLVEGAKKVYLASPSFMLIFPERENVKLRFSRTSADYIGITFTAVGLCFFVINLPLLKQNKMSVGFSQLTNELYETMNGILMKSDLFIHFTEFIDKNRNKVLICVLFTLILSFSALTLFSEKMDPNVLYTEGLHYLNQERYEEARKRFEMVIQKYPISGAANNASYYSAITYFKQGDYQRTIEAFERLIANYPDSNSVPEAYYHIALSNAYLNNTEKAKEIYQSIIDRYPTSVWAQHSGARLSELIGKNNGQVEDANFLYNKAMKYFDAREYETAKKEFLKVAKEYPNEKIAEYSMYFNAICFFKQGQYRDVVREFGDFIKAFPQSDYVPEAYYHIGISYQRQNDHPKAKTMFEKVLSDFPNSRWAGYSKEALKNSPTEGERAL